MIKPKRRVIGLHACQQTLQCHPKSIQKSYLSQHWEKSQALKKNHSLLTSHQISIQYVSPHFLKSWQGIALDCSNQPLMDWQKIKKAKKMLLVALDGLEDPQNLGSIIRSSWLFGVDGIFIGKHQNVQLTPHVHKIASGGVEHVPIEVVTNLSHAIKQLKSYGFWIYGLSTPQIKKAKPLWDADFAQKTVLVVGGEGKGLHNTVQKNCDQILTIPQKDNTHSLNASTSLSIALYEVCRLKSRL